MKSKAINIIALAALLMFGTGCDEYLDVNHNPNVLEELPNAQILIPSAQASIGNQLMGWDFGFGGGYWTQYWTQNYNASQFKTLCDYTTQSWSGAYQALTAGVLTDLSKALVMTADKKEDLGIYYIAEALSIFTWQVLTDVWGDIPYSQAIQGNKAVVAPVFDKQEDIYKDLQSRVDKLLALDISEATFNPIYDYVFAGDLEQWHQFVNSLKLKLMLRLSETPGYDNAKVLNFVQDNDFIANSAKLPGSIWDDAQEGKRHPMREFEAGGASYLTTNVIACKTLLDYLQDHADPRLYTIYKSKKGGGYAGAFFGDYESTEDSDGNGKNDKDESYSTSNFTGDMDVMIMSNWEVYFDIAEVYVRAGNIPGAKDFYDMAVLASLMQHGISSTNIILPGGYAAWNPSNKDNALEQIGLQRWIAFANYQHIEAFLERNRTKYPAVDEIDIKSNRSKAYANFPIGHLTISVKGRNILNGELPASPLYPDAVMTRNANAPAQKKNVGVKVWWNMKNAK